MKQQKTITYRFDSRYQEKVLLEDGTPVTLRTVIPADKLLLADGMDRFSPESRYNRFLGARTGLSEADLRYLTEIDGVDHFAIGALILPDKGIGVARFVRFGDERDVAEPAIAVLDAYQNQGMGLLLFTRLVAAARERGIKRFHGSMLQDNKPMHRLLHAVGGKTSLEQKGPIVEFEMLIG